MIKLLEFQAFVNGLTDEQLYSDSVPEDAPVPAIAWHHTGEIRQIGRNQDGAKQPRRDAWVLHIIAKRTADIMAVYNKLLPQLDNVKTADFQDVIVSADRLETRQVGAKYRRFIIEMETTNSPRANYGYNQGTIVALNGMDWTFSRPVELHNDDLIEFEFINTGGDSALDLLSAVEGDIYLKVVNGAIVTRGPCYFNSVTDVNFLASDGSRGKIRGKYTGDDKVSVWAPLTDMPIYNFKVTRGEAGLAAGAEDLLFPLDERLTDSYGSGITMNLE